MKNLHLIKKYSFSALSLVIFVSIILTACGKGNGTIRSGNDAAPLAPLAGKELSGDQERFDSYVYSVNKLKEKYKEVIVLDARTKGEYAKGHLPGAVQAHWTDLANVKVNQGDKGWAVILPDDVLSSKFGALGIDGKKTVVIYSDSLGGWGEEGRILWVFRVFGLKNTVILNGGIEAWKKSGGEVNKTAVKITAVTGPKAQPDQDLFAGTDYLAGKLGSVNILDVREDEEFAGTKVYGEKSKGRIPGAKHIWFKDFYNADGTLQSPAQIRARVESVGFASKDEVVNYCTGGIRSGFATIALRIAGYDKARNYNASFSEWAGTSQKIDKTVLKKL